MRKARTIRLLIIVAIACMVIMLPGCNEPIDSSSSKSDSKSYSGESAGDMNCVIVGSSHSNSKASLEDVDGYVRGAKDAEGYLGAVRLDGNPEAVTEEINDDGAKLGEDTENEHKNSKNIEKENKEFVSDAMSVIESIDAQSSEVDIVGAIKEANKQLGNASNEELDNVVVIVGTGLSTTGVVDFASTGLASLDLNDYANWVQQSGQMPKLDNVDKIVWIGFEDVADPQDEFPTEAKKEELQAFYETILKSAGVKEIEWKDSAGSGEDPDSSLPSVSTVEMPAKPKYGAGDTVTLTDGESGITFGGDSAYVDPNNVKVVDIANSIKNGGQKVTLTGYTADHDTSAYGGNDGLAQARADAVKDALVGLECPESSITTKSGGVGNKGSDEANRCVVVKFE